MGKYQSLNVLNMKQKNYMSDDTVAEVARMINTSGANRKQRRDISRSLNKMENILAHAQAHVDKSAYADYKKDLDRDMVHFFGILALTLDEDYHWKEDETHDQISSMLERVGRKINKYRVEGYDMDDIVKLVDERYNILLIPEE